MKLLIVILMSLSSVFAFSQTKKASKAAAAGFTREYGLAGCGLGSIMMGKRGAQIFAATTNGTGVQTVGITVGTSNCVDSASAEVASRMDQFILVNRSQLQGDIARGQGETISALGTYMGCSSSGKIGPALKAQYSSIFASDVRANEISDSIISIILSNPELSQECQNLG